MSILPESIHSSSCCLLVISFIPLMLNVATLICLLWGIFSGSTLLLVPLLLSYFPHSFMALCMMMAFLLIVFLIVSGGWEVFPVPLVKGWRGGNAISCLAHSRHFLYCLLCDEVFIFL